MIARRRAFEAAAQRAANASAFPKAADNHASLPTAMAFPENVYLNGSFLMPLPSDWSSASVTKGSSNFRITQPSGMPEAQATLAVVAAAPTNAVQPLPSEQRKMLGGVMTTDLRRTVIDRMVSAGGWVVNDRQRDIGGHRVFEVIAQTPATGDGKPEQVWDFYFTEANGRVYSLMTRTGGSATQKVAADAEKFLSTFQPQDAKR